MLRGGSWDGYPARCRAAFRLTFDVRDRGSSPGLGFRVLVGVDAVKAAMAKRDESSANRPSGRTTDAPPLAIALFAADQAIQHQEAWAKHLGVPIEFSNSIGMKFRLIPPGEFTAKSLLREADDLLGATLGK